MYIQNRTAKMAFSLVIGLLAALATWLQFAGFGHDAWRLLTTWIALIATIYYILTAAVMFFAPRRSVGQELSPLIQGGLIVAGVAVLLMYIVSYLLDCYLPGAQINNFLIGFILPILMILSWVMFSTKGKWHAYDPFYWLALLAIYFSAILVSGEFMPRSAHFAYPYEFLDYPSIGVDTMLWWFAIIAVVILIIGYLFWTLDFTFSGQLSRHIVMPKIKTVIIEEEIEDEPSSKVSPQPEKKTEKETKKKLKTKSHQTESKTINDPKHHPEPKPEEKPVKLVTTGSRNLPVIAAQRQAAHTQAQKQAQKPAQPKTTPAEPSSHTKNSPKSKSSIPPIRIIEKIDLTEPKKSAGNPNQPNTKTQEIVIKDGQKSVVPKPKSEKPKNEKVEKAKPESSKTKNPKPKKPEPQKSQPKKSPA